MVPAESHRSTPLAAVKLLHTAVWAFFVVCILAIPVAAARRDFGLAAVLSAVVLVECAIIVINRGRCPLTDLASRYTDERRDNFDIYLPLWLARYNKSIFGTAFLLSEIYLLGVWIAS